MFSQLSPNRNHQPRCTNFARLEDAVRDRRRLTGAIKLHSNFRKLEKCAHNGCTACRVVRQAVLLAQITGRQVELLENQDEPIYMQWWRGKGIGPQPTGELEVRVVLGKPIGEEASGVVPADQSLVGRPITVPASVKIPLADNVSCPRLPERRFDLVLPQLKAWLDECCNKHGAHCANLAWSKENPRRLLEIVSDSEVKLVDASTGPKLDYVALSYCWGDGGTGSNTTWANLPDRMDGFPMQSLPKTIQDACVLVKKLDLKYIWVDQLCIVQPMTDLPGEDWDLEGSRMHIVYGNAVFTLNACSSEGSTDGLLRPRKAWTYPVQPFFFDGRWLTNHVATLKEVRGKAPLSTRAWVLQEERLSPRLLYFCGQMFYWSCFMVQHTETAPRTSTKPGPAAQPAIPKGDHEWMSDAQAFLDVRFEGHKEGLHREWQDLVEAYCLRNMTQISDRFRAISGLAAQYLRVYLNKDNQILGQEYLAGLWRATFAQDLAWSPQELCEPRMALTDLAPTWSWASLPLRTRVSHLRPFESVDDFTLLGSPDSAPANPDPGVVVLAACQAGAKRKSVLVRGRFQPIMNSNFISVRWNEIQAQNGLSREHNLSKYIDEHFYARDFASGRIVAHEPTKRPMECQLDYKYLDPWESKAHAGSGLGVYVEDDAEKDLYGLRIEKKTMLILQKAAASDSAGEDTQAQGGRQRLPVYQRVGICHNVRDTFFDGIGLTDLELV